MSKRRTGLDKAIESVQNKILALKMALEALEEQRGDGAQPPRAVSRRPTHRRNTPATLTLEPDGGQK